MFVCGELVDHLVWLTVFIPYFVRIVQCCLDFQEQNEENKNNQ